MSGSRAPLFLVAALGSFSLLLVFVLVLMLRDKEGLAAPVVVEVLTAAKTTFPDDFGRLDDLVPFAGGVAPIAAEVVPIEHAPEFRDADWVRAQNADSYTIQVLAVRDEEAVKRFLADREDRARYTYFLNPQDGSNWYVVTTGSFSSVELARGVADSGNFGLDTKPFPKRMGAYQSGSTGAVPVPATSAPMPSPAPSQGTVAP